MSPPPASPPAAAPFHSVVVVGGGISGLVAARTLVAAGVTDLLVVEASDRLGGRIKQAEGVLPWPVEAGPEFVHGANSQLKGVLEEMGCKLREFGWPDRWYFGRQQRMVDSSVKVEELDQLHEWFDDVGDTATPPPGDDVSAEQWLAARGATPLQVAAAEACYANDFGCSLRQLGLTEMVIENRRWDSGESYLIPDVSLGKLVGHLSRGLPTRTDWPVSRIHHGPHGALLTGPRGAAIRCRHVVVTVSLRMLQMGRPAFCPPLPPAKTRAVARLRMSNAIKVILGLSRPIWPDGFFDVVCTDCFVPEFWVTRYTPSSDNGGALHGIVGFIAGDAAEAASQLPPQEVLARTLAQLDEMFGTPERQRPASAALATWRVVDWSKEPYVGGAYSYPSMGAHAGDREALGEPVGDTLFFAGEATHPAVNPCLQAAMETGQEAARRIAALMQPFPSKL